MFVSVKTCTTENSFIYLNYYFSVQRLNERNPWRNFKIERERFFPLFWPCSSTTVFADLIYQFQQTLTCSKSTTDAIE